MEKHQKGSHTGQSSMRRIWLWLSERFSFSRFPYESTTIKTCDYTIFNFKKYNILTSTNLPNRSCAIASTIREESRVPLLKVGSPKNPNSRNNSDMDLITRTVMRNPNSEAKAALYELHAKLASKLLNQSDNGLTWLLGGSSMNARGGFKDARQLREFLQNQPDTISSSRLITGLHTLLTAIAYRALHHTRTIAPYSPQTLDQRNIDALYNGAHPNFYDYSAPDHSESYCDSRTSLAGGQYPHYDPNTQLISNPREEISDGSDTEDLPAPRRLGGMVFWKRSNNRCTTWAGAAHEGNVPVRLGISGTTLHSLAVIEWLFGKAPGKLEIKTLELLVATLIIPTYHRGDYHTIAETSAAFQHFVATRPGGNASNAVLSPQQALKRGLELMERAVTNLYQMDIRSLGSEILSETVDIPYVSN